jgi:S-adenosylmethionine:tRNA ribosyltransferase-isomerase
MTGTSVTGPAWVAPAEAGLDEEIDAASGPDVPGGLDFSLPPEREAHEPPEARGTARDGVRLMVSRTAAGQVSQHNFTDLPRLLLPGDLLVVNTSATLPAAVPVTGAHPAGYPPAWSGTGRRASPGTVSLSSPVPAVVHFSTPLPDGDWLVELRAADGSTTRPFSGGSAGQELGLPAGAVLTLGSRFTGRLWRARLSTAVVPYLLRHGAPIATPTCAGRGRSSGTRPCSAPGREARRCQAPAARSRRRW